MQNIQNIINEAEQRWGNRLYKYCKNLFSDFSLPSHNHEHHKRVWSYAKELLQNLSNIKSFDSDFVEALLFACYFHDTGLISNLDETHGEDSKVIFQDYVKANNINLELQDMVALAIEKHDDKLYKSDHTNPNSLLTILTTADDLDAYGYIGVIRYIEIYLMRGMSEKEIPKKVLENLENRFRNFLKHYSFLNNYADKQRNRYNTTKTFFEKLVSKSSETTQKTYDFILANCVNRDVSEIIEISNDLNEMPFFKYLKNEI